MFINNKTNMFLMTILAKILQSPDTKTDQLVYLKRAHSSEISTIEAKIYSSLNEDAILQEMGVYIAKAKALDSHTLAVTDCGKTLADYLHSGHYELHELREMFTAFLESNIRVRKRVNEVIGQTLSPKDKTFLHQYHLDRLVSSMQEVSANPNKITTEEVQLHFYAYRIMNALGIYGDQFKKAYTDLIGSRLEANSLQFGQFISDNTLRNNTSPDGKTVIPFDFNSIKFGPKQIDDAVIAGQYLFEGPLAIYRTKDEALKLINSLHQIHGGPETAEEYLSAFVLSCFHENHVIRGYRTRSARNFMQSDKPFTTEEYLAFRKNFDEIEYHESAAINMLEQFPEVFVGPLSEGKTEPNSAQSEHRKKMEYIVETISNHTFHRVQFLLSPRFQRGEQMLDDYRRQS